MTKNLAMLKELKKQKTKDLPGLYQTFMEGCDTTQGGTLQVLYSN